MDPTAELIAANRQDSASRLERVLRKSGFEGRALLHYYDNLPDVLWWRTWQEAKCVKAPSDEVRKLLRERLRIGLLCISCGILPAVRSAGKAGREGRDLCMKCWNQEHPRDSDE